LNKIVAVSVGTVIASAFLGVLYYALIHSKKQRIDDDSKTSHSAQVFDSDPMFQPFLNQSKSGKAMMGVKALEHDRWIEVDRSYRDQLSLKKELVVTRWDEVFVSRTHPSTHLAKREVLDMLVEFLPKRFPSLYKVDQRETTIIRNLITNDEWTVPYDRIDPELPDPLLIASLLVQEDLCILEEEQQEGVSGTGNYVLTAGCVCFPMRWTLKEKFLRSLSDIHSPVPAFERDLRMPVESLFRSLSAPVWRANWSIFDDLQNSLDLYSPASTLDKSWDRESKVKDFTEAGEKLFLRVERQTLRRLPKSNAILFTIRTYQRPLKALAGHPHVIPKLLEAIQSMNPECADYKNRHLWGDVAVKYLQQLLPTTS